MQSTVLLSASAPPLTRAVGQHPPAPPSLKRPAEPGHPAQRVGDRPDPAEGVARRWPAGDGDRPARRHDQLHLARVPGPQPGACGLTVPAIWCRAVSWVWFMLGVVAVRRGQGVIGFGGVWGSGGWVLL